MVGPIGGTQKEVYSRNRVLDRRYGSAHLLYILWRCSFSRVSRQEISREIGIGEGSVRTAIKQLVDLGLADTARKGVGQTPAGKQFMHDLGIEFPGELPGQAVNGPCNVLVIVRDSGHMMSSYISTRDAAMMSGAEGCIPFRITDGKCNSPFYDFMGFEYPELEPVIGSCRIHDGDAAIICGARDLPTATVSAFSAVLDLLEEGKIAMPWSCS